jgi:hypothetical protein
MGSGIGASLTTFSPGTTIASSPANSNFSALNAGGISNDGIITTTGSGNIVQANARSTYFIAPYQLVNNATYNAGTTYTVTCTGVGGVPAGASGVLVEGYLYPTAAAQQLNFYPHGSTASGYPQKIAPSTNPYDFQFVMPLDATGNMDIKPLAGNPVVYMWMYGYLY